MKMRQTSEVPASQGTLRTDYQQPVEGRSEAGSSLLPSPTLHWLDFRILASTSVGECVSAVLSNPVCGHCYHSQVTVIATFKYLHSIGIPKVTSLFCVTVPFLLPYSLQSSNPVRKQHVLVKEQKLNKLKRHTWLRLVKPGCGIQIQVS